MSDAGSLIPDERRPDDGASAADLFAAAGTGIDDVSGLASDFLNQFNEVVMLLDIVAGGDESLLDELDAWRPRSYEAHFLASGYSDRASVLDHYRVAPAPVRRRLGALADELSAMVLAGVVFIMTCRDGRASLPVLAASLAGEVRQRLEALDAIVHAGARRPSQEDVSALFRSRAA